MDESFGMFFFIIFLNFFMRNYTRVFSNSMISFTSSECHDDSAYTIHEKSIVQSFLDYFFHVLPANIPMESKENTMELLRNRIGQIITDLPVVTP